jgi:hypothetical protein
MTHNTKGENPLDVPNIQEETNAPVHLMGPDYITTTKEL